jgi:hypothetical protein
MLLLFVLYTKDLIKPQAKNKKLRASNQVIMVPAILMNLCLSICQFFAGVPVLNSQNEVVSHLV